MKKIILIGMVLCATLSAKEWDFENPNGDPFLLTITYEKGRDIGWSLPVAKFLTLKMTPGQEGSLLTNYGGVNENVIDLSDPTYSIDLHLPIYKLWKK